MSRSVLSGAPVRVPVMSSENTRVGSPLSSVQGIVRIAIIKNCIDSMAGVVGFCFMSGPFVGGGGVTRPLSNDCDRAPIPAGAA